MALAGVDRVAVTTDDQAIAEEASREGAQVIARPDELSGPTATSESALVHALAEFERANAFIPDVIVFAQVTSPFIDPRDVRAAIGHVACGRADVVFAAAPTHTFTWVQTEQSLQPLGHPRDSRQRRQEREPHFAETGAFYAMDTAGFLNAGFRFFGRLAVQEVSPDTAIEIDSPQDLAVARALAPILDPRLYRAVLDVDALAMDFDGVHTDNSVCLGQDGSEAVRVNRSDGLGIAMLRAIGLPMVVLTSETVPIAGYRAAKLGIPIQGGIADKAAALKAWLSRNGIDPARTAFLGNDLNDAPTMATVGWPCAVNDAHPEIRAAARVVTAARGGHGAVREIADAIVAARAAKEPL
jgi:N-acylneuraminate cytidylyltransferase